MSRRYKVKDLMIDFGSQAGGRRRGRFGLFPPTDFPPPTPWTPITPIANEQLLLRSRNPEDLAALKDELRQTLAEVEAQERVMAESMRPQTLEEAEELERKLGEALDDVRIQKEELRRRSSKGSR